ncbi:unnamed protein product, partial [Scytosiphon promiscuus]
MFNGSLGRGGHADAAIAWHCVRWQGLRVHERYRRYISAASCDPQSPQQNCHRGHPSGWTIPSTW